MRCPLGEVQSSPLRPLLAGWGETACGGFGGLEASRAGALAFVQEDGPATLARRRTHLADSFLRCDAAELLIKAKDAAPVRGPGATNRPLLAGWGAAIAAPRRGAEPAAVAVFGAAEADVHRRMRALQRARRTARHTLRRWRLLVVVRRARLLPLRWVLSRARELISRWQKGQPAEKCLPPSMAAARHQTAEGSGRRLHALGHRP